MPSIQLHGLSESRGKGLPSNSLPKLLQTPSGLAVLEIQGTLNAPNPNVNDSELEDGHVMSAPEVGKLVFPLYDASKPAGDTAWQKRVHLYIGKHQRMTGEVKKLAKPFALIRRRDPDASNAESDRNDLEVAEIIYYRLIFAHRPEPVGAAVS